MNLTDIVNKVIYKSENIQLHLYEIQEQVKLVYVNRKQQKKMVAKGRKGEKFPAHFEKVERFSIWVRITEIHICQN